MSADNNGFRPSGNRSGYAGEDDRLTEDRSAQDIPYSAVGTLPHRLEFELFHAGLVWGDGRTLDADRMLENGLCGIDSDLVVCSISMFKPEVVILDVELKIWQNELQEERQYGYPHCLCTLEQLIA